jgi:HJR/Mrr/RecB family endonuclease
MIKNLKVIHNDLHHKIKVHMNKILLWKANTNKTSRAQETRAAIYFESLQHTKLQHGNINLSQKVHLNQSLVHHQEATISRITMVHNHGPR